MPSSETRGQFRLLQLVTKGFRGYVLVFKWGVIIVEVGNSQNGIFLVHYYALICDDQ